jgi:hypothetical protein
MADWAGVRMRIDERVREVHLNHLCPGGASLPETTSRPVGLDPEPAAPAWPALDTASARAGGQPCGRCGRPIVPGQDARRRAGDAGGAWVHETCPPG